MKKHPFLNEIIHEIFSTSDGAVNIEKCNNCQRIQIHKLYRIFWLKWSLLKRKVYMKKICKINYSRKKNVIFILCLFCYEFGCNAASYSFFLLVYVLNIQN